MINTHNIINTHTTSSNRTTWYCEAPIHPNHSNTPIKTSSSHHHPAYPLQVHLPLSQPPQSPARAPLRVPSAAAAPSLLHAVPVPFPSRPRGHRAVAEGRPGGGMLISHAGANGDDHHPSMIIIKNGGENTWMQVDTDIHGVEAHAHGIGHKKWCGSTPITCWSTPNIVWVDTQGVGRKRKTTRGSTRQ